MLYLLYSCFFMREKTSLCPMDSPTTSLGIAGRWQISNQPIAWQQHSTFRHVDMAKRTFKLSISDMAVGGRSAGLSISEIVGFFHRTIAKVYREWFKKVKILSEQQFSRWKHLIDVRCQKSLARLLQTDSETMATQTPTRYSQGMQKSISERWSRWAIAPCHKAQTILNWTKITSTVTEYFWDVVEQ